MSELILMNIRKLENEFLRFLYEKCGTIRPKKLILIPKSVNLIPQPQIPFTIVYCMDQGSQSRFGNPTNCDNRWYCIIDIVITN